MVSVEPIGDVKKVNILLRIDVKGVCWGHNPWYAISSCFVSHVSLAKGGGMTASLISIIRIPLWSCVVKGVEADWHCEMGQP